MTKSSADATRDSVQKYRRAGLIQAKVWTHPTEAWAVRLYAGRQPNTHQALKRLKGEK